LALKAERKEELARMNLPSEAEMRIRLRRFMFRAGLNAAEMGDALGYSPTAILLFLRANYCPNHVVESNSLALRAAAQAYLDRNGVEPEFAFRASSHKTNAYREVRASAMRALQHGSAYLVDGAPGTEKTYTLRRIEKEINASGKGRAIYIYARAHHSPQSFLIECCIQADIPSRGSIDMLVRKLRYFLANDRTLLMVDEAQHLDHKGLAVLRQLLDMPPHFGVLLAGSHDLTQRLSHWQMEQWRSRLRKTHYLNGPSKAEAAQILRKELGEMTDAECSAFLADCMATGQRMKEKGGKLVPEKFDYISARDLFNAIDGIQQRLAQTQTTQAQEGEA
jgi:type II secretory pathway predicted ATPase ExeA